MEQELVILTAPTSTPSQRGEAGVPIRSDPIHKAVLCRIGVVRIVFTEIRMRLKGKIAIVVGAGQSPLRQRPRHGFAFRPGRREGAGSR
jgi:hypothetical protein